MREFTPSERRDFRNYMRKYIENESIPLRKPEIKDFVNNIPPMKKLMDEIGVAKMIVKIRTERDAFSEK